ncbi:MAG: hypothetical protein N2111_14410 [Candidatus Sumerlaeaceae bacterium]|nr:hypothetical protein [Candidatus Sumerlaeaceae bacterium]MCX7719578.1 hypothetical protein [Candidatus Sumerlaeaceae bacterium]
MLGFIWLLLVRRDASNICENSESLPQRQTINNGELLIKEILQALRGHCRLRRWPGVLWVCGVQRPLDGG